MNRCYLVEELNPYRGLVPIPNLASSCPTLYPIKCSINNNTVSSINTQISEWHQFLQFSKLQLYCTEVWIHELNFSDIKGCVARSHWVGVLVDNWRMCLVPYAVCWDYLCGACFVLCVLFAEAHPVLCCGVFVFVCFCGGSNTSCAVFLCLCACAEAQTLAVGIVEAASYTSFLPHPPPWTCWGNLIWWGSKCLNRVKIAKKQMLFVFPKWLDLTEGQRCVFFKRKIEWIDHQLILCSTFLSYRSVSRWLNTVITGSQWTKSSCWWSYCIVYSLWRL